MQHLLLWICIGFAGMEVFSYLIHRFVFHGWLWKIHETHHRSHPNDHPFELNDLFSLGFALASIALIWQGAATPFTSYQFPLGLGIAIYGLLYFIIHDLYTHRRFFPFKSDNKALQTIRRAHQRHHQTTEKDGFEPYGLFLFPYTKFNKPFQRKEKNHLS